MYAPDRYQSLDADFIIAFGGAKRAADALGTIGFVQRDGMYKHPDSQFTVEFPPGPLAVSRRILTAYDVLRRGEQVLFITRPEDVVCDRLAKFYYWNDRSALRTALDVARKKSVHLEYVRQWSAEEGELTKFAEFEQRMSGSRFSR